jgi:hypothetical protein
MVSGSDRTFRLDDLFVFDLANNHQESVSHGARISRRDVLDDFSDPELLISGAQSSDELRHGLVPLPSTEPLTASRRPAATQRITICPPRHRFTCRFT